MLLGIFRQLSVSMKNWGVESWAIEYADVVLHTITPIVWLILFVGIMDRQSFLETWFMPFLGAFAAFLANSVPIGGGIVYIPVLSLLGANIQLGSAFTIAIMPFGNGVFGFFRWLLKDPSMIRWEVFPYFVLSICVVSFVSVFLLPTPDTFWIKTGFGIFCLALGVIVLLAVYKGGLRAVFGFSSVSSNKNITEKHQHGDLIALIDPNSTQKNRILDEIYDDEEEKATQEGHDSELDDLLLAEYETSSTPTNSSNSHHNNSTIDQHDQPLSDHQCWTLILTGFFGGLVFVPNIGIGPALFTYLLLALYGYNETAAMVTGIITGGWVCALPLLWNLLLVPQVVPYKLWVMTLPGVFLGAKVRCFTVVLRFI